MASTTSGSGGVVAFQSRYARIAALLARRAAERQYRSFMRCVPLAFVLVACAHEAVAPPSADAYAALFLTEDDLPGLHRAQDARDRGADESDGAFAKHGGQRAGTVTWIGAKDATIYRVVDSRWVFPNAGDAASYLAETRQLHADQDLPVEATK